ncbi:AI-2E family transporter [Streptomyces sp. RB6PN25]|uniref:AI-2E family transporter n=1 Tax=Streptomyces humicola TaxID=2953240 RepID=A0ABT1Q279_9ACTN|nr:AI-2E family transporter [Streptomyces humicola]MCQ4083979.1 AI-2E family transporter [Streptomyces humicola]
MDRARSAAAVQATPRGDDESVSRGLRKAAGYAWRLLVVGVLVYETFTILGRFQLVAVAVFLALVVTSALRPLTDLMGRHLPRSLAVVLALLGSLLLLFALLSLAGYLVAGESAKLATEFRGGIGQIERWLERPPFRISPRTLSDLQGKIGSFISSHRSLLVSSALTGASRVVEAATGAALALFCSIFFIYSGERLWHWFHLQLPRTSRSAWDRAGRAAWTTFAGYTRGIIIVAVTNAVLVGVALSLLRVPLALPLAVLEFFASFVPLVGSPIALAVASVVALAGRGPIIAVVVLLLIVIIGQIEGHVLHPLVMAWAVRLHPVVIAVSVVAGGIVAGVIGAVVAVPMLSVAWAVVCALRDRSPNPRSGHH